MCWPQNRPRPHPTKQRMRTCATPRRWIKNRQEASVWEHDTNDKDFKRPKVTTAQGLPNHLWYRKKAEKSRTRGTTREKSEVRTPVREKTHHSDDPSLAQSRKTGLGVTGYGVLHPSSQPMAGYGRKPTTKEKRGVCPPMKLLRRRLLG